MNEDRVVGTARNFGGKVEEGLGRATGNTKTQAQGIVDQATGAAQDLYGQARDAAADAAGKARDVAADAASTARDSTASVERWLRNTIETQPYTAVLVALGVGWLLGRTHRPL
jgi:uncharacterized protein YjbJ (UPF0337 family)